MVERESESTRCDSPVFLTDVQQVRKHHHVSIHLSKTIELDGEQFIHSPRCTRVHYSNHQRSLSIAISLSLSLGSRARTRMVIVPAPLCYTHVAT